MATTEGSFSTMPLSRTKIKVLAVPRSMAISLEKNPRKLLRNMRRNQSLKALLTRTIVLENALTVSTAVGRFNRRDEYGNLCCTGMYECRERRMRRSGRFHIQKYILHFHVSGPRTGTQDCASCAFAHHRARGCRLRRDAFPHPRSDRADERRGYRRRRPHGPSERGRPAAARGRGHRAQPAREVPENRAGGRGRSVPGAQGNRIAHTAKTQRAIFWNF